MLNLPRSRTFLARLLVIGILLLTTASLLPTATRNRLKLRTVSSNRSVQLAAIRQHRLAHWAAFGTLSFFLALLGRNLVQRIWALAGVVALGTLIECLQYLIYRGTFEVWDVRDDSYAAFVGFLCATLASVLLARASEVALKSIKPSRSEIL
jgi:glycopeptide antibiotics resistance protein